MLSQFVVYAVLGALLQAQSSEPEPRRLAAAVARFDGDFAALSGARELRDGGGRVLVSDFKEPALYVVDLRSGSATRLGRKGSGPNEYVQPGGMYTGSGDTTYVLDRGQPRFLLVTGDGRLVGTRSIAMQGVSSASDADMDRQQLDAAGQAYFIDPDAVFARLRRGGDVAGDSANLLRFDASRQRSDTVAKLQQAERRTLGSDGRVVRSQIVLFSPADGFTVAPNGRVAVVRAAPYRVDWVETDGRVRRGPAVEHDEVPVTAADRAVFSEGGGSGAVSTDKAGQRAPSTSGRTSPIFAATKPPIVPDEMLVAPDSRVWVARYMPAGSSRVVYDVFDSLGVRVDRVAFPARSRVIGFGAGTVFVSERDQDDVPRFRKYAL